MKRLSRLLYASIPILLLLMLVAWTASNAGSYRSSWLGTFWVLNNLAPQYQPISDYGVSMYQLNDALRRLAHILIGFMAVMIRVMNPAYPEGMMLAILFANLFAPLIDNMVVRANIKRRVARNGV